MTCGDLSGWPLEYVTRCRSGQMRPRSLCVRVNSGLVAGQWWKLNAASSQLIITSIIVVVCCNLLVNVSPASKQLCFIQPVREFDLTKYRKVWKRLLCTRSRASCSFTRVPLVTKQYDLLPVKFSQRRWCCAAGKVITDQAESNRLAA